MYNLSIFLVNPDDFKIELLEEFELESLDEIPSKLKEISSGNIIKIMPLDLKTRTVVHISESDDKVVMLVLNLEKVSNISYDTIYKVLRKHIAKQVAEIL